MKNKKITSAILTSLFVSACTQSVVETKEESVSSSLDSVEVISYVEMPNLVNEDEKMPEDRPVDVAPLVGNYLAALMADYEGDTSSSAEYFKEAENADPQNYFLKQKTFVLQLSLGNMDEAIRLARDLSHFHDALPVVYLVLFVDSVRHNDLSEARSYLQKTIQAAPELVHLQTIKGYLELADGEAFDPILKSFQEIDIPESLMAHKYYHLGRLLEIGDKREQALEMYHKAEKIDSASVFPVVRMGALYRLLADYKAAAEVYDAFEKSNKNSTMLYREREKLASKAAVEDLDTSLSYSVAEVLFGVATLMGQTGDRFGAKQVLSMVSYLQPDFTLAPYYEGMLAEQSSMDQDAENAYKKVPEGSLPYLSSQLRLAYLLIDKGEVDQGLADMEALYQRYPQFDVLRRSLAESYYIAERFEKAIESYTTLINEKGEANLSADDAWNFLARGSSYERLGQEEKAVADMEQAIALRPNYAQALNYLGYMWAEKGENLEKAFLYISRAVLLMPSDPAVLDSMGWVLYQMDKSDKAVFFLEKSVSLNGDDALIYAHLGDVYLKVGRVKDAVDSWKEALSLKGVDAKLKESLQQKIRQYQSSAE